MRYLLVLVLLTTAFLAGCVSYSGDPYHMLGRKLGDAEVIHETEYMLMSGSMIVRCCHYDYRGVRYQLGVKDGKVISISTSDEKFRTPEGAIVGDTLRKIRKLTPEEVVREKGWAYHVQLPSGWNAAFAIGKSMTEGSLMEDDKVRFFFLRD